MFKQVKARLLILLISLVTLFNPQVALGKSSSINMENLDRGFIKVNYEAKEAADMKLMITKGVSSYTYSVDSKSNYTLQLGNGDYTVSVLKQVEGSKYRVLEQEKISLNLSDTKDVFLQSTQIVNWNSKMKAIKKAESLVKNKKSEMDKIKEIYQYVIKNISYDNKKAKNIKGEYLPSIEDTYFSNSGICYDYAALTAGMLRSIGIPTKLVMGYKSDVNEYHAWNEVYLSDKKQWVIIDTTYDASSKNPEMIKNAKEYTVNKIY